MRTRIEAVHAAANISYQARSATCRPRRSSYWARSPGRSANPGRSSPQLRDRHVVQAEEPAEIELCRTYRGELEIENGGCLAGVVEDRVGKLRVSQTRAWGPAGCRPVLPHHPNAS